MADGGVPMERQEEARAAALALARAMQTGLGAAAGRTGFSHRRRRYDIGHAERRERRAVRAFATGAFVALVVVPMLVVALYLWRMAEDLYVAEARFLLRANEAEQIDRIDALTGVPAAELTRDTLVIAEFLESPALVAALEAGPGLRARMAGPGVDPWRPETWTTSDWPARLAPDATAEDLHAHWERMSAVRVDSRGGIVTVEVAAFTPQDAATLVAAALAAAEALVNDLNARQWSEAVAKAEASFAEAADRLAAAQRDLAVARAEAGVIDAEREAGAVSGLLADLRAELIRLRQTRAARARHLSEGSAQLAALDSRTAALEGEIARLTETASAGSLPRLMAEFSGLDVREDLAERQFLAAARTLEETRAAAEARQLYLDVFVEPAPPEESTRPDRPLVAGIALAVCLALWAAASGAHAGVRAHRSR